MCFGCFQVVASRADPVLIFLDTEFTDLLNPELLSLGLVTLDGREHYAELDLTTDAGQARVKASSDFVRYGGVLGFWGLVAGATGTEWEMGRRTGEWLLALAKESDTRIEVAFDYSMDYELMEYVIRDAGLWEQVREVVLPVNVNPITATITGELAAEECFRALGQRGGRGLKRHHALADALALRAACRWRPPGERTQPGNKQSVGPAAGTDPNDGFKKQCDHRS